VFADAPRDHDLPPLLKSLHDALAGSLADYNLRAAHKSAVALLARDYPPGTTLDEHLRQLR
jgi:hypothetical protein